MNKNEKKHLNVVNIVLLVLLVLIILVSWRYVSFSNKCKQYVSLEYRIGNRPSEELKYGYYKSGSTIMSKFNTYEDAVKSCTAGWSSFR